VVPRSLRLECGLAIVRLESGNNGALAMLNQPTDGVGFLDITIDFIF
jgi:hypothetical protein